MIDVHYQQHSQRYIVTHGLPSEDGMRYIYLTLDDMEADELMWKLMAEIEKAP